MRIRYFRANKIARKCFIDMFPIVLRGIVWLEICLILYKLYIWFQNTQKSLWKCLILWTIPYVVLQEADNLPRRMLKQPIYVSVESEHMDYNNLSGKYNFHSIKNNATAFERDGGALPKFAKHPYYLAMYEDGWVFQHSEHFKNNEQRYWIEKTTTGLWTYFSWEKLCYQLVWIQWKYKYSESDIFAVENNWLGAKQSGFTEFPKTTVQIFANENEFKNYKESKRNKGWFLYVLFHHTHCSSQFHHFHAKVNFQLNILFTLSSSLLKLWLISP